MPVVRRPMKSRSIGASRGSEWDLGNGLAGTAILRGEFVSLVN